MPIPVKGTDLVYVPVPEVACTSIKRGLLTHIDPDLAARLGTRQAAPFATSTTGRPPFRCG